MELLKNLEGLSADEQMSAVVELQKAAMKHLEEQKQASIGKSAEMVILGLKKIKSDFEAKFDSLNYDIQTKVANLKDGEQGLQGPKGEQGDRGLDGYQGKDGRDGKDGQDGVDGVDGVGVTDAKIDFDGSLVITLSDGREINVGEVVPVDVAEKIRTVHNIQSGSGGDSQTVLDAIAALQATIATYGTMATQNANNVAITGGTINNTTIGATTPSTGVFTTLTGNSTSQFGRSSANYLQATGGATTKAVEFKALGSDTNIAQVFQSKGTGAIDLAAGSSGINISNGGTVTAITRTVLGSYTSNPTVIISAPTTANGVQATATVSVQCTAATIASGGTGYTVGDTISMVGGTFTSVGTFRVASVSGGVITSVDTPNFASYTVTPSNPVSVTGGTGSGATLNVIYFIGTFTITNAGSGYVEQPTVSFSGGGSTGGGAAFAAVGSSTVVRSIGGDIGFYTPSSGQPAFVIRNNNNTNANYLTTLPTSTGGAVYTGVVGTDTNSSAVWYSKGTGSQFFATNSGAQSQFVVSHTASAVNYVQVTGAATGNGVTLSAAGSDTNVQVNILAKGASGVSIGSYSGKGGLYVTAPSVGVNYGQIDGANTGGAVRLSAQGSDTNISLVLQPKGTGALQAQQTDSTATGGNARGANAVDWQTARGAAAQVASGSNSFVGGGKNNTASGFSSVLTGGDSNQVTSSYASVNGGTGNTGSGAFAFLGGGQSNTSSKDWSVVVGGNANTSAGYYNLIGGGFTNSGTSGSAVTTQSGTMNATTAVTLSGSNASIKVGQYITGTSIASDTYVAAISGTSLTLSKVASGSSTSTLSFFTPHGVVVGGGNNQATGSYSFIGGGGDAGTAANRNVASGAWSAVVGGGKNTASGIASFIGGGGFDGSAFLPNTASGISAVIVGGLNNTASANYAFIGNGGTNTASAANAFIGCGYSNTASGTASSVSAGNNNTANGANSSIVSGQFGTTRSINSNAVFSSATITTSLGVSQTALVVLGKQTTDATATVLTSDGAAGGTTNQVILPNNSAYFFTGEVVAGVTGGGNTKGWTIEGVIKRGANAASTALVGTPTVTSSYADAGASTWTIAVTADTTNGGLAVTFTGQASTTIRTVARVNTVEMTF